jgi:hypothetical protein
MQCGEAAAEELSMKTIQFSAIAVLALAIQTGCATDRPMTQGMSRQTEAATACAGVPEAEMEANPLQSTQVLSVTPLREPAFTGRGPRTLKGATVVVAATPGMTQQWLQRLLECNAAQRALTNTESDEEVCPLGLTKGVPTVSSLPDSFAVNLRTSDPSDAERLLKQCGLLVNRP